MGASERSSKAIRRRLKAVSPKDSAESDHASQEAVRRLIPPTPCPLAPSVTTPLYRTIVSQALPNALRGGVFLDTRGPRESGGGVGEATPTLSGVPFGAEGYGVRLPGLSSLVVVLPAVSAGGGAHASSARASPLPVAA